MHLFGFKTGFFLFQPKKWSFISKSVLLIVLLEVQPIPKSPDLSRSRLFWLFWKGKNSVLQPNKHVPSLTRFSHYMLLCASAVCVCPKTSFLKTWLIYMKPNVIATITIWPWSLKKFWYISWTCYWQLYMYLIFH